jgi:large subunit ribosomal protein L12
VFDLEYVYTALLLHSAKQEINEGNIKKVLEASGIKADDAKTKALVSALEGVNIEEVIKQTAVPVAVAAPAVGEKKAESEKKEKPEDTEKKSEEAVAGLASLFG